MRWETMTKSLLVTVVLAAVSGVYAEEQGLSKEAIEKLEAARAAAQKKMAQQPKPVAKPETATKVDPAEAPKLEVDPPVWDFGKVWYGTPLSKDIKLTNTGKGVLKLSPPKTSCGCTGSIVGKRELAPGESTFMKVTYNSKKATVNVHQTVRLGSNDPEHPEIRVSVQGTVNPLFDFGPARTPIVTFGQVDSNDTKTAELVIKNKYAEAEGGKPVKLTLSDRPVQNYDVKLEEIKPGMEYKLIVTTKPPLPTGSVGRQVVLNTDLDFMKTLPVRLNAFVQPTLRVQPQTLYVSPKLTFPSTKKLTLVTKQGVNMNIEKIECSSDKVTWKVDESPVQARGPRQYKTIDVTVPPGSEIPAEGFKLKITTNLDDPEFKEITVGIKPTPTRRPRAITRRQVIRPSGPPAPAVAAPKQVEQKPAQPKSEAKTTDAS